MNKPRYFKLRNPEINVMKRLAQVAMGEADSSILNRNNKTTVCHLSIKGYIKVNATKDGIELSEKGIVWCNHFIDGFAS